MSPKNDDLINCKRPSVIMPSTLRVSEERELVPKTGFQPSINGESTKKYIPKLARLLTPFSPIFRQTFACIGCLGLVVSSGMTSGYSAVLLPQLQAVNSTIPINETQATWIASLGALPMCLGCLICGPLMERYGRKLTHQLIGIPFTLGWILIASASNVNLLYAGRMLTGLCVGLAGPLGTVFMAETSAPVYRGLFLASISLAVSLGILLTHLFGTYLTWSLNAMICGYFPIFCFLSLACLPETPVWLLDNHGEAAARVSFQFYRGYQAEDELTELLDTGRRRRLEKQSSVTKSWSQNIDRVFLKQLCIMMAFFFAQQFCGVNAVAFYTVKIFQDLGTDIDEYFATNLIDVVRALMSLVACYLLKRFSRRALAVSSGIGTAISLGALSGFLIAVQNDLIPSTHLTWIPVFCLISYICWTSTGLVPLPWVMIGEVFPASGRGIGSGISSTFGFICLFLVVKTSPGMFKGLGPAGTFGLYGCVALLGAIFLYFFLPETRNRTLVDIEESLKNGGDGKSTKPLEA